MLAAVAFTYSGFMISHLKHLSMVNVACWLPLGLWCIERCRRCADTGDGPAARRSLVWLGGVMALQVLAGHAQIAYYAGLVYGAYFAARFLRATTARASPPSPPPASSSDPIGAARARLLRNPLTLWFVGCMALAGGISAVQILPTNELVSVSDRADGVDFDHASQFRYELGNWKLFFFPYANGDPGAATYRGKGIFWEDYGYVGVLTLVLALFGVVRGWRRWHVRFFAVSAIVSFLLVLGPATPLFEMAFRAVPGMSFFRFPTRFLLIVDASLAVLAAVGLETALAKRAGTRLGWAAFAVVTADLLFFQLPQNAIVDRKVWSAPPPTVQHIRRGQDGGIFRVYSPRGKETHVAAYAMAKGWRGSLDPYVQQRDFVQPNTNVVWGLSAADGYAQLTPSYVVDVWGDQNRTGLVGRLAGARDAVLSPAPAWAKILSLFNVKYVLTPWRVEAAGLESRGTVGQAMVYENTSVLPRAFLVPGFRIVAGREAALAALVADDFDPAQEAVLFEAPRQVRPSPRVAGGRATIERYDRNSVAIRAVTDDAALLVLSDTFYPGWVAKVDGDETKILQANLCQRAVVVPAGEHVVTFAYEPRVVTAGFGVSTVSVAVWLGLLRLGRRQRRPDAGQEGGC
jgi:hypothetical protein